MTSPILKYPALYEAASDLSADSQWQYLWSLRIEYGLLILAAFLSMEFSLARSYFVVCALIFLLTLILMLWRAKEKPEQNWYKGRALAESIKTSTWCYAMRAPPFEDAPSVQIRRAEFRNYLVSIIEANRQIGSRLPPEHSASDQITREMEDIRALDWEARREIYENQRIREQRDWYKGKAVANKKASRRWVAAAGIAYVAAILLVLCRIAEPEPKFWPIEPVIVVAASIAGWIQTKKFNELVSAYTLTAFEIGIIQGKAPEVATEHAFAEFVNEAERAFSREHTQWVARQEHA